jgi:hypothetical protein
VGAVSANQNHEGASVLECFEINAQLLMTFVVERGRCHGVHHQVQDGDEEQEHAFVL